MKTIVAILFAIAVIKFSTAQEQPKEHLVKLKQTESGINDSLNYEIIIFDPGFESWLITGAKPMGYHSQTYLESWNQRYVAEWNYRYYGGQNIDIIESNIDYDYTIDYGLELNYRLYNYFVYVETVLKLPLLERAGH